MKRTFKGMISVLAAVVSLALLAGAFAMPAAAAPPDTTNFAAEVARLVNEERAKGGKAPLNYGNSALNAAAAQRAREYAANPSLIHTRPGGRSYSTVLAEFGVPWLACSENIAFGQRSPEQVVREWMESTGHRRNIMGQSADFNWIGIALAEDAYGRFYWAQLFVRSFSLSVDIVAEPDEPAGEPGESTEPGGNPGGDYSLPMSGGGGFFTALAGVFTGLWSAVTGLFSAIFG